MYTCPASLDLIMVFCVVRPQLPKAQGLTQYCIGARGHPYSACEGHPSSSTAPRGERNKVACV